MNDKSISCNNQKTEAIENVPPPSSMKAGELLLEKTTDVEKEANHCGVISIRPYFKDNSPIQKIFFDNLLKALQDQSFTKLAQKNEWGDFINGAFQIKLSSDQNRRTECKYTKFADYFSLKSDFTLPSSVEVAYYLTKLLDQAPEIKKAGYALDSVYLLIQVCTC